jgi:isopropylmalate/isohomocitrate dehydrogenase-like protein
MSAYRICLLPGDGIGPEVIGEARRLLESLPLQFSWDEGAIGYGAYHKYGAPLPDETIAKVRSANATLFGAVTTPPDIPNYSSPIIRLRKTFDLYANIRPCRSIPNSISRVGIDLVLVRENTEDLYVGIERLEENGDKAIGEMVITRKGSERAARAAFDLARKHGFNKVTIVHKANVLRQTTGLFRRVAYEVAKDYPEINAEDMLVDTCAMELVRAPEQFQVIVTTNLFGDILSDEASMLVGGLGLACSGNIGVSTAVFEPVHGSAPKLVGTGAANPMATFLSAGMMLEYLGEGIQAGRIQKAVMKAIENQHTTADLGGSLSTTQVTDEVISILRSLA